MFDSLRCCLNPKVIVGLVVAGVAIWLVAPAGGAAALPLLIALVCPLSMGAMAWQMRRGSGSAMNPATNPAMTLPPTAGTEDVDRELRALREEITIARARRQLASRDDHPLN
ncbi:DUF2933 domain-containing protein [Modestobacter sp. DSM 44400]|uniref:DUF2933 domain-containing protein n=1 Tax=Modestobacter sp. DSM 44400 TaxID=1550230 RepID=UPI000B89C411